MRGPWLALAALALTSPALAQDDGLRFLRALDEAAMSASAPLDGWSGKPLSLADVDADGDLDIIAHDRNARVYVVDPASGRALVEVKTRYPYGPDLGPFNGAKAADLDADGVMDLVAVNRAAVVTRWRLAPEGASLAWDRHLDELHDAPTADAGPVLGDLDRDGDLEIVVLTEERGLYALRPDGALHWSVDVHGGNAEAWIGDIDADEDLDVVAWTDAGRVLAIDGASGDVLWLFEAREHKIHPASVTGRGLVSDLDGDGSLEVAFCARNIEDRERYERNHFALFLVRDGALVWKRVPTWGQPLCSAYLMASDVDGDGIKEILGLDWNTIGHKPGNWERLGPAHAFAFDLDGDERWHTSIDTFNAKFPIALADVEGDARQELVAYDDDALVLLDARDGDVLRRIPLGGRRVTQSILVDDVLGDGRTIVVVPVEGRGSALLLFDAGAGRAPPAFGGTVAIPSVAPLSPAPPGPAKPVAARIEPTPEVAPEGPGAPATPRRATPLGVGPLLAAAGALATALHRKAHQPAAPLVRPEVVLRCCERS